jgi:starvation-inducible outer membrane lipoprotein
MLFAVKRLLLLLALLLSGCASAPEPEVRTAEPVKTIDIRSWPSGLVVELNGEYVGTTPLELVINTTRYGVWTADFGRGYSPIILRASTPDAAGWEQKVWYPGDRIPSRVLFRIPGAMKRLAVN